MSETIPMVLRDPPDGYRGPVTADVHPKEVENLRPFGWTEAEQPATGLQPSPLADDAVPAADVPETGLPSPVAIPDDWRGLHHNRKIALAEQIAPRFIAAEGQTRTQAAEDVISIELARQAGEPLTNDPA